MLTEQTETDLKVGPVQLTPPISIGLVALGFLWACAVNLYVFHFDKPAFNQPAAVTTLSFWVFAIVGVWLFHDLGERFQSVLDRLRNRGVLLMTEEELDGFKREVQSKSNHAARQGGMFMFALVVIFYSSGYAASGETPEIYALVQWIFEAVANFILGMYMGRTIVHACFGYLLQSRHISVAIMPGHPDGAAGMSPIGALFLRQAGVMLIPAIYFGLGWTVMSTLDFDPDSVWGKFCDQWAGVTLLLFIVMMAVQLIGFFAPMWLFHVEMQNQKREQLAVADELSIRITEVKARLASEEDEAQLNLLKDRLSEMTARHSEIEDLPNWPVSVSVRRQFALSNVIVTLPVILTLWDSISKLVMQSD